MKRLAVLAAVVFGPAVQAAGPDLPPIPDVRPDPQLAPTLPQIPRPILNGTDLRQGEAGRAEMILPTPPTRHHVRPTVKVEAGPDAAATGLPVRGANGGAGTAQTPAPPPHIPSTLPTPPDKDIPAAPAKDAPAPPAQAAPGGPDCHGAAHRGVWRRLTTFLCYHPSKVYYPIHPTPHYAPLNTLFPCEEKGLCGPNGCGAHGYAVPASGQMPGANGSPTPESAGGTGPAGAAAPARARPGFVSRLFNRGGGNAVKVESSWATSGETIPGYRFAVPETPAVTGQRYPTPPLVGTSYKVTPEK